MVSQAYAKSDSNKIDLSFSFNYISTDEIFFYTENSMHSNGSNFSYSEINIGTYSIVNGDVVLTGLPIQKVSSVGTP
ncbi:hypothetical protein D3C86_1605310 [compost metagenome]